MINRFSAIGADLANLVSALEPYDSGVAAFVAELANNVPRADSAVGVLFGVRSCLLNFVAPVVDKISDAAARERVARDMERCLAYRIEFGSFGRDKLVESNV